MWRRFFALFLCGTYPLIQKESWKNLSENEKAFERLQKRFTKSALEALK